MANTPRKRIVEIRGRLKRLAAVQDGTNGWAAFYEKDAKFLLNALKRAERNCANWRQLGEKYYDLYHGKRTP